MKERPVKAKDRDLDQAIENDATFYGWARLLAVSHPPIICHPFEIQNLNSKNSNYSRLFLSIRFALEVDFEEFFTKESLVSNARN